MDSNHHFSLLLTKLPEYRRCWTEYEMVSNEVLDKFGDNISTVLKKSGARASVSELTEKTIHALGNSFPNPESERDPQLEGSITAVIGYIRCREEVAAILEDLRDEIERIAVRLLNGDLSATVSRSDLAQETICALLHALPKSFKGTTVPKLRAYIRKVLNNKLIDEHRRQDSRQALAVDPNDLQGVPAGGQGSSPGPGTQIDRAEQSTRLLKVIPKFFEVFPTANQLEQRVEAQSQSLDLEEARHRMMDELNERFEQGFRNQSPSKFRRDTIREEIAQHTETLMVAFGRVKPEAVEALEGLRSEEQRVALLFKYLLQLKYLEIAEIMGICGYGNGQGPMTTTAVAGYIKRGTGCSLVRLLGCGSSE